MRKAIFTLVLALACAFTAEAQIDLQASFGLGYAAQYIHESLPYAEKIIANNISVSAAWQTGNFRYRAGVEYLTTGYTGTGFFIYVNGTTPNTGLGDYQIIIRHIGIPLALGYKLQLSRRLSLMPEVGMLVTYNPGASDMRNVYGAIKGNHDWEPMAQGDFDRSYKRYSWFGTANLQLSYQWKRWAFFAGPSYYHMISNLSKASFYGNISTDQKEYQLSFKVGAAYSLKSEKEAPKEEAH